MGTVYRSRRSDGPLYNRRVHAPESVKAVLFDYGLVLTGPPLPVAWQRMATITGLTDPELHHAYWAPRHDYDRGSYTGREYWHEVGRVAGVTLTPAQVDDLIGADTALWTQPNPPMIAWAGRLQAAGTPTGILSNLGDSMMQGILAELPWLAAFNHATWSHTLQLAKPEAAIYAHAAEGLMIPAAAILFVDDREVNIAGALAAGMQAIHYTSQDEFEAEMQRRGLNRLWLEGRLE